MVERRDGSCPTLMDTLYSICPAVFGPAVACQLRVEGTQSQPRVTLHCKCQLDVLAATQPPQNIPELPADTHNDAEAGGESSPTAASQHGPPSVVGKPQVEDIQAQVAPEPATSALDPSGGSHLAEGAQLRGRDRLHGQPGLGLVQESDLTGAVCESADVGEADDAAIALPDVSGAAPEAEQGALPEQATASGSDATAMFHVPPDSPAVQSDTGREASTSSGERRDGCAWKEPAEHGMCPARVVSGCLHEGVKVHVAGVRVQPPGGSGELLQASLLALHELLHAPDLFLYVVVHMPPELCVQ